MPAVATLLTVALVGGEMLGRPDLSLAATRVFRQETAKDFEEGEVTGASILPGGEVVPGLVTTRTAVDAAFIWCGTTSRDGSVAYFGSGDEGKIFAVPSGGRAGGAGGKEASSGSGAGNDSAKQSGNAADGGARRLASVDAPWVTALAVRGDGGLLAGTTPAGRVFAVDPRNGATRVLASLGTGHVWALARDDKAAVTYVGTGAPGKIFAVDDQGKTRQVWDARDKHVVSLIRDSDGTLLAGTSEEAILYRVRPDGRSQALQDFEAEEVRSIVRAPSGLYVAVNDFEKVAGVGTTSGPVAAKGTKIVLAAGGPPASAGSLPRPGARKAKSAVYRLEADGRIEQVFALADGYLTALAVAEDGAILASAGTQGHVHRIAADRTSSLVVDVPERQVLALVRAPGAALLVGTGDVGGVYRAHPPGPRGGGQYLSKVLDAEWPARWGTLRWLGSQVAFETRSGNTARPDAGWNEWKPLEKARTNAMGGTGHVGSPGARYLQYRATFAGVGSRMRGVTASYVPQNQRARVTELTLADATPAGGATSASTSQPAAAQAPHSTVLKLRWKTENPDGDEVIYRLSFRQVGETVWRPLISASADSLTKPEYDWNTEGIPDGLYVVRVTVSDERSQPRDQALVYAFESTPLLVDNGRPQVLDMAATYPVVSGRARDDASPISRIEFAVDGGEFQLVSPTDGIADDLVEPFSFRLPALPRGPHAVAVRVTDGADNVGAAQITVKAP